MYVLNYSPANGSEITYFRVVIVKIIFKMCKCHINFLWIFKASL